MAKKRPKERLQASQQKMHTVRKNRSDINQSKLSFSKRLSVFITDAWL